MKPKTPALLLTSSPFLKHPQDMPYIMWQVVLWLLPVALASIYYFGLSALLVIIASTAGTVSSEWYFKRSTIKDGSAVITGFLLALTLPPGIPLWMAFLGGVVSIALGKLLFGGIGYNIFNPALVGRAFLQAAFPVALTTWPTHSDLSGFFQIKATNLALPFMKTNVDVITAATPLAKMKFESLSTEYTHLLLGNTGGSLGETCAIVILICGLVLAVRNLLNWRIPVSILATVFVFALILNLVDPDKYPGPLFHLLSGGLVLGAVFMATDMVTSPITQLGCWLFGMAIGILIVVIRQFGGLPEGVMYSILLMNAMTPLINKLTQPKIYGAIKKRK